MKSSEARLAGRHFRDLEREEVPPCLQERAAFMSPYSLVRSSIHPYRRINEVSHGHFKPTPVNYPPYSAPALPFRWMLKGEAPGLREHYPLDEVSDDLEPDLGFKTGWWQDYRNQTTLLDTFWAHVKKEESLVFFYRQAGTAHG